MAKYSPELKDTAKTLYIKGWTVQEIAKELGVTERTVYNWRDAGAWELFSPPDTVEQGISRRINVLAERENKTPAEVLSLIHI